MDNGLTTAQLVRINSDNCINRIQIFKLGGAMPLISGRARPEGPKPEAQRPQREGRVLGERQPAS